MSKKLYTAAKYTFIIVLFLTVAYYLVYSKFNTRTSLIIISGLSGKFYLDILLASTALSLSAFITVSSIYKYRKRPHNTILLAIFILILTAYGLFPKSINSYRNFKIISSPVGKHTVLITELSSSVFTAPYTAYYQPIGRFLYKLSFTNYDENPQIIWRNDGFYISRDSNLYHDSYVDYTQYNKGALK